MCVWNVSIGPLLFALSLASATAASFSRSNCTIASKKDMAMLAVSFSGLERNAAVSAGGRPMTLKFWKFSSSSSSNLKVLRSNPASRKFSHEGVLWMTGRSGSVVSNSMGIASLLKPDRAAYVEAGCRMEPPMTPT